MRFSLLQLGKVYGIEAHVLSPAETKDLYPLMNVGDLCGTLFVPKDGTMDPAGTCTTLVRAATARGALVTDSKSALGSGPGLDGVDRSGHPGRKEERQRSVSYT